MQRLEGYDLHIVKNIREALKIKLRDDSLPQEKKAKYLSLILEADKTIERKERIIKEQIDNFIKTI